MAVPKFVQDNWGNLLNTKPLSVVYWLVLFIFLLSIVAPFQLMPILQAINTPVFHFRLAAGAATLALYVAVQFYALTLIVI